MSDNRFAIRRVNGLSNARVVINYVKDHEPGTIFPFAEIASELAKDTNRLYQDKDVCQIVRKANIRLLKDHRRELHNVVGVGFRLAPAAEHTQLALARRTKADRQIERGLLTIQNARLNEMDENSRKVAEGTLLIMSGIHLQMKQIELTTQRHERAIAELFQRENVINGQQVLPTATEE